MAIYLAPLAVEGEGLEVIGERVAEKGSRVALAREELRRALGSQGDPLKVFQSLSGIVGGQEVGAGTGVMYVRGSNASDNAVWFNRLPVGYRYHWGGLQSTIDPDLVQDFNMFLGGFPVEYDDRLRGVVDERLRPPKKDRLHQTYRIGTHASAFLLEGPINANDSYYVAGRRSYIDFLMTPEQFSDVATTTRCRRKNATASRRPPSFSMPRRCGGAIWPAVRSRRRTSPPATP